MKKLTVLVMIPALAIFLTVAMTSAGGQHWKHWWGIRGTYAMVATGSCLHSTLGFDSRTLPTGDPIWNPKPNSVVWAASTMAQATWTFERNWTGTVSGTNYVIDFPPGNPNLPFLGPAARQNVISLTFTYEVTRDGEITVTFDNPPTLPPDPPVLPRLYGWISMDHKTLTLGNANVIQPFGTPPSSVICNIGRVLIRVSDQDDD